jgi:FHA domain
MHGTQAQSAFHASLTAPDTSGFPVITTFLDVHDPSGAFVHDISLPDLTILENDQPLSALDLQERKTGIQFVIAITPGESFATRDGLGVTRYEYFVHGLLEGTWAHLPTGMDDFSLITMGGPQLMHTSNSGAIRSALEVYRPGTEGTAPSLEVLAAALQVASDPTPRPGMERAILFITPPQSSEVALGIQSIIASASQQDIHIFVWLVAAQESIDLPATDLLRNLASQTRATFFAYSLDEPIPDLETLLEPLRYVYSLEYESQVSTAGPQLVAAQVRVGDQTVTTLPQSFDINLQPPSLVLLPYPAQITRAFSGAVTPAAEGTVAELTPIQQLLNLQVTFPDSYDRPLARTSLYVDGALHTENTSPPFDQFTWDLRSYTQAGEHTLRVEAVDNLGLTGSTDEISIRIIVPPATQGMVVTLTQKSPLLVGAVGVVSAAVLLLALIMAGRIRPRPHPGQVSRPAGSRDKTVPAGSRQRLHQDMDSIAQGVKIATTPSGQPGLSPKNWRQHIPWLRRQEKPLPAMAYLIPLVGTDEPTLTAPMQINVDDVTLGRDPARTNLVIPHPSLEGVHARLQHEGQRFTLTDAGSVAGTWVNFRKVPPGGARLEHADIIHLGAVGFRFNLADPPQVRKVVVTPLEPEP